MKYLTFGSMISLGEVLCRGTKLLISMVILGVAIIGLTIASGVVVLCGPRKFSLDYAPRIGVNQVNHVI